MENEELNEKGSKEPHNDGPTTEGAALPTASSPLYGDVTTRSGSAALYSLTVVGRDASNTRAGRQWAQVSASNQYRNYPYVSVVFNQTLPINSTWSMTDVNGDVVSSGTVANSNTNTLYLIFWNLLSGQPSLNGSGVFNLALGHSSLNSFQNHVIDSDSGGLVIVANIDGGEDFVEVMGLVADELEERDELSSGG